jgi:hypothetical protein
MAFFCSEILCLTCKVEGYKYLKGLYNHYTLRHPNSPRCANLCDAVNRTAWAKKHTPKAPKTPIMVDGLTYQQFMKAKQAELKATITNSQERMRAIAKMWQDAKAQPTPSKTPLEALLDMLCPNREAIVSPDPALLPMPKMFALQAEVIEVEEVDEKVAEVEEDDEKVVALEAEVDDEVMEEVAEKVSCMASHADLQDNAYNCIVLDIGFSTPISRKEFIECMSKRRKKVYPEVRDYSKDEYDNMWETYKEEIEAL